MYDLMSSINSRLKGNEPDEERTGPRGIKSQGPFKLRYITAGQQRRAAARKEATAKRKRNKVYRKTWIRGRMGLAVLRGQLQAVGVLEYRNPDFVPCPDMVDNARMALEGAYGSVEKAHEAYLEATA